MKAKLILQFEFKYHKIIEAIKEVEIPDGLYGVEPLPTTINLTNDHELEAELSVENFNMSNQTATLDTISIDITQYCSIEGVPAFIELMKAYEWETEFSTSIHQELADRDRQRIVEAESVNSKSLSSFSWSLIILSVLLVASLSFALII